MNLKNQPPVYVPDEYVAEIEKLPELIKAASVEG